MLLNFPDSFLLIQVVKVLDIFLLLFGSLFKILFKLKDSFTIVVNLIL